jgi:hypothetical protein
MRRVLVTLAVVAAAAAVVAALRRRPQPEAPFAAPAARPPQEPGPVRPLAHEPPGTADEAPATRFVELAEDEQSRRHEAAERLKADLAGR